MDTIAVSLAVLLAHVVRYGIAGIVVLDGGALVQHHAITSVVLIVTWLAALWSLGSLDLKLMGAGSWEFARVVKVTMAVFGTAAIAAYLSRWEFGRTYVGIVLPLGLLLLLLGRYLMRRILVEERKLGRSMATAVVVGSRESAAHLIGELSRTPQAGIEIVAACTPSAVEPVETTPHLRGVPVVADICDAAAYVAEHKIDTVVVTGSDEVTPKALKRLAWDLEPHGADLVLAPGLTDVAFPRIHTRPVPGMALVHVEAPGYTVPQLQFKRVFDVVGSALLIALFSLPLAVTALAIKLTSPGPVLFRQTRIGVNGEPFQVLKFRSMVVDAESRLKEVVGDNVGIYYKAQDDPRITGVGKFIRRFSIDELPQLFNVLGGSMSLVGPRPLTPHGQELDVTEIRRRVLIKPGMTGLWQVSGRNNLSIDESMRLDLYYVENWSMAEDLHILLRTVRAVVGRDGAS
ncbi:sugar transferase [Xylanimonas sp. McL0601]|uniref:sugar transferase n=1 Tax=Xylanimonas sp. McL0601 TaxID=3414739 RepID=UPI003CE94606